MPRAADSGTGGLWSRSSKPTRKGGEIEECQRALDCLEAETDSALDQFVAAAEGAYSFYSTMEKVESQLASAERMQKGENDLQLNESVVLAEKLEGEIAHAEKLAAGAGVSDTQGEWAGDFEKARAALDRMNLLVRKARAGNDGGEAMEARSALMSFRRESALFKKKLAKLKSYLSDRKNPAYAKVGRARARLSRLKARVGETFSRIARSRLKKKIAEARSEMALFMQTERAGRIFVDHKHVTLTSGRKVSRMPLTESAGFALSDLVPPMRRSIERAARGGAHLVGSYEISQGGGVLRIGERTISGDAIIYRERSFRL